MAAVRAVAVAVVVLLAACNSQLDERLTNKVCNPQGECLPGFTCNPNWRCVPYTFSLRAQNPGPLLIETMDGGAGAAAPADSGALLAVGWADDAPATDAGATDGSVRDASMPSSSPPMPPHDGKHGDEEGGDHHKSEEPSGEK